MPSLFSNSRANEVVGRLEDILIYRKIDDGISYLTEYEIQNLMLIMKELISDLKNLKEVIDSDDREVIEDDVWRQKLMA